MTCRRLALALFLDECDFSEERIRQYWVHPINKKQKYLEISYIIMCVSVSVSVNVCV